eukprot:15016696-Alexandrium_andersonii.AAC.1
MTRRRRYLSAPLDLMQPGVDDPIDTSQGWHVHPEHVIVEARTAIVPPPRTSRHAVSDPARKARYAAIATL